MYNGRMFTNLKVGQEVVIIGPDRQGCSDALFSTVKVVKIWRRYQNDLDNAYIVIETSHGEFRGDYAVVPVGEFDKLLDEMLANPEATSFSVGSLSLFKEPGDACYLLFQRCRKGFYQMQPEDHDLYMLARLPPD